jgi:signal transduction histidine kinase
MQEARLLTDGRAAIQRLMALGALLMALIVVGTGALLLAGSRALDSLEAREHRAMVKSLVSRRLERVDNDMRLAASVIRRRTQQQPGMPAATEAQEAALMLRARGHDWTVMLDASDRAVPAGPGQRGSAMPAADFAAAARPLLQRVRAGANSASGLVVVGTVPYLAVAAPVALTPSEADGSIAPKTLLLSAQRLDHEVPAAARRLGAIGARLMPGEPRSETAVGVSDVSGRPAGQIAWSSQHVGLKALDDAAPVMLAGFGVFVLIAGALAWQIVRVAKGLIEHERKLADAMQALGEARDRAEAANIAKSEFLANMSHEIRTPLNGVLGMAQVMGRSELSPDDRARLQVIRTSGEDLLRLLNDLLDISKIEAGCMELDPHDFDLEDLVEAATRPFAVMAEQKDVAFSVSIDAPAPGAVARGWRTAAPGARQSDLERRQVH